MADAPKRMSVQLDGPYACLVEYVLASDYDALAAALDSATLELTGACCERNDAHDAMKILAKRIGELEAALRDARDDVAECNNRETKSWRKAENAARLANIDRLLAVDREGEPT